ncbi:sodium:solute symporter family protein [Pontibacter akesuensis]|uniref:Solute:Na+ symporter, SSS family n=1 Tax=Pontibacter akesuensis TaxID=388950 RepID=A0A1I7FYH1_9BACT|nr:sodium:solute symporter family protein [Pontibacter akesuensis]GHA59881.1 3-guanidinopropionate transporter [Pontibacter akesuensis]SFU41215.1 solute:Na+ symporter, SSS family [Pontibacter akesuensis]
MHYIDSSIFVLYMVAMLGVGVYFLRKNEGAEDYYVGGRTMSSGHIGLSVVATDVGGGFSIGLGGLGFAMGLSGSWMLFTGLLGAWLAAVFLIPKVKGNPAFARFLTFPQLFGYYFNRRVALLAGIISAIGYTGFTSSQILAGAKLASGTFVALNLNTALLIMGIIAVVYTVMGGMKAVIYTDTIQWAILMGGLVFIGVPVSFLAVGGMETLRFSQLFSIDYLTAQSSRSMAAIRSTLPPEFLSLTNVTWQELVNWAITIIPIWFVGMTLYQRIYASRDTKTAQRAWYSAGLFEWPIMAFMGVSLGILARVAAEQGMFESLGAAGAMVDPETGLPMLLRTVLPVGLMGLMLASYFSAILSTADSCLMASSGNIVTDVLSHFYKLDQDSPRTLRLSQIVTLLTGAFALWLATMMTNVLDLMLYSYAFMVSGLFVPIIGALFWKRRSSVAAFWAMLLGGAVTVTLQVCSLSAPDPGADLTGLAQTLHPYFPADVSQTWLTLSQFELEELMRRTLSSASIVHIPLVNLTFRLPFNLDPNLFGLTASLILYLSLTYLFPDKQEFKHGR